MKKLIGLALVGVLAAVLGCGGGAAETKGGSTTPAGGSADAGAAAPAAKASALCIFSPAFCYPSNT
jgi:hypothetical protein